MNDFDIAGLIVGALIIVMAKMMATGTSLIAVYAMKTEDEMQRKQAEILGKQ